MSEQKKEYTSVADLVGDGIVSVGNGIANLGRFLVGSKPGEAIDEAIDKVFGKEDEVIAPEVIVPEATKKPAVKRKTRAKPAGNTKKPTPTKRTAPVKTVQSKKPIRVVKKKTTKQPINDA